MYTEDFLKLTMQEVADLLADEWDKSDNDYYAACLARGLDDDGKVLCLSVVLSHKPLKGITFEETEVN